MLSWLNEQTGFQLHETAKQEAADSAALPEDNSVVWLEAELDNEEQAGWLNALIIEQGMILYEATRKRERLEGWFMDAVSGLSHRGRRNEDHCRHDLEGIAP